MDPINYTTETFRINIQSINEYEVDITQLAECINSLSPVGDDIVLNYWDEIECLEKISRTILKIFCRNYPERFPGFGINALLNIINANHDVGNVRQMLLLHASKTYFAAGIEDAAQFFENASTMEMVEINDKLREWKSLADHVIQHPEINSIINQTILEYYQKMPPYRSGPIEVHFVSNQTKYLRGFAGINSVYFNNEHFVEKLGIHATQMEEDSEFRNNVDLMLEIDIIALAIHEFSHVRLRQVTENLNTSTLVMKDAGLQLMELEFGRIIERKIFGNQINWFRSLQRSNKTYIRDFKWAIETASKLPDKSQLYGVVIRPPPTIKGVDMEEMESVFE